jgi:histidine triad (HIT) family protein
MKDCIFCKIIKGDIPAEKVFENDLVLAFLDINPVNHGHTLIIPKEHFSTLEETEDRFLCEMTKTAKKIGSVLKDAIKADGYNLGLNNGEDAGQVVPHVHLHVMPRFKGDGLALWPGKPVSPESMAEIATAIRQSIDV